MHSKMNGSSEDPLQWCDWGKPLKPLFKIISQFTNSHPNLILFSHVCLGLPSGLFPSCFPSKILYAFLISPTHAKCPAPITLLRMIALIMFCESTSHEAPPYAVFSSLPPFSPFKGQVFSSAPCSQTPLICVHRILQENLWSRNSSRVFLKYVLLQRQTCSLNRLCLL